MALTKADIALLLGTDLGKPGGGDTFGVALQSGYHLTVQIQAMLDSFVKAEAQRDAQESAAIAALTTLVQSLAVSSGALTPEELSTLTETLKQAAADAGNAATQRIESEIQSLRAHLGDTAQ